MTDWEAQLDRIVTLAKAAGDVILNQRLDGFEARQKEDNSLVTTADLAADELITAELRDLFPGDAILTEESGFLPGASGERVWVVDPLDGTQAFADGKDDFAVLIGSVMAGRPQLGVVHFPGRATTYYAARGHGAFKMTGAGPVPMPARPGLIHRTLALSPSTPPRDRALCYEATGLGAGPLIHGAAAKFIAVVEGQAAGYFSGHGLSVWDTVAPGVVLQETGNVLTCESGRELQYEVLLSHWKHPRGVLAAGLEFHGNLVANLGQVLAIQG